MLEHLYPNSWGFTRHLKYLDDAIVRTIKRGGFLIVEMPVRHGKSELGTFGTPLWFLERWSNKQVIVASHAQKFAAKFGRRVRNSINEHHRSLTVRLAEDILSASEWQTKSEGGMMSVGVEGSLTGRGVDLLIIDDPISNWEDANSVQKREKLWDWWDTTASTRIEPGGAVIVIMARWHPDDLVGRLKNPEWNPDFEEDWEVINLPAIAEENDQLGRKVGQALWPERWPKKKLLKIAKKSNRTWNALYQQHPRKTEGNMFKKEWFNVYETLPIPSKGRVKLVRAWDLAATKKSQQRAEPDWTRGGLIAVIDGQFYLHDMQSTRGTPKEVKDLIKDTAKKDGKRIPIWFWRDPGQAGIDQEDTYRREILPGYSVKFKPATADKVAYAEPVSDAAESGNFYIRSRPWKRIVLDEAEDFPNATHDDTIDMLSLGVLGLTDNAAQAKRRAPRSAGRKKNKWKQVA